MKKLVYISALSAVLSLGGCTKFLEVDPVAQVNVTDFYKNKYELDAAIAGMYSGFQQTMVGESQYNDRYHIWGEYRADNFDRFLSYTTPNTTEIALNSLTPDNAWADWSRLYSVINRTNNNLKYIPAIKDAQVTTAVVNSALSQSYAMRALCYFYIVRVWGDAPVWLEPFENLNMPAERAKEPAAKILDDVIIPDLKKAYDLVVKNQTTNVFTIGESAICAMLADVYMWKKDYTNANIWFANLFKARSPLGVAYTGTSDANLQPTATWKSIFTSPGTSPEGIWNLHWEYSQNGCACNMISYTANNKPMQLDPVLYTNYFLPSTQAVNNGDIRPKQTLDIYSVANTANNNRDRFIKWYNSPVNPTTTTVTANLAAYYNEKVPVYLPMYRLSDIYLLYAESLNGSGDLANALKYLNYIRKRANVPQYLATDPLVATKDAMELTILKERQYELIGEGKRWFDLVRTGKVKQIMDPILKARQVAAGNVDAPGFSDPRKVYWPISRAVLNSNKLLVQNPGYTD